MRVTIWGLLFGLLFFAGGAVVTGCSSSASNPVGGDDDSSAPPGETGGTDSGWTSPDSAVKGGVDATAPSDAGKPTDATVPPKDAGAHDAHVLDAHVLDANVLDANVPDTNVPMVPGADASITAFNQTLICFGSGASGPCSRTVDTQVTFPATGTFSNITLHVTLNCPPDGCDPWDRVGSIDIVTPPASAGGAETLTELARFVTPYNIVAGTNKPPAWDIDVTELRPLLAGTITVRGFIDTWSPQGNAAANGGGWWLGATFEMTGGTPAKEPIAVVPIWVWKTTGKEPTQIAYGDPSNPIPSSLPTQNVALPPGATSFGVRSIITGHGQANLDNCAEFCAKDHTWQVGSTPNTATVFRTDCANFPSSGTYTYSRAGWCPGANVIPWDFDVTSQVGSGGTVPITYSVTAYTNTCNGTDCSGCGGGTCAYNGGSHTPPFYYVQSLLIAFK
jgi:hypothetical protein